MGGHRAATPLDRSPPIASRPLRVALIGSTRFPVAEPFAGGLEAHLWTLTRQLRSRGHAVTLFAADGSDHGLGVPTVPAPRLVVSAAALADVSTPSLRQLADHHGYLSLMLALAGPRAGDFDVVHNNALHHLPIAMSGLLPHPVLSTLHSPPTPWLQTAVRTRPARGGGVFVAVSAHTASVWEPDTGPVRVVPNGVDTDRWTPGPGGGDLLWSGRIVAEKGPDLAVLAAALAGRRIRLAGPIGDQSYFDRVLRPLLGDGAVYLGHLDHAELAAEVGAASVVLVTPRWEEPYGLVVAEALACGTPVAGLARGGIPEVVDDRSAVLVEPGADETAHDVPALAAAIERAGGLSRGDARRRAVTHCSASVMADAYEGIYAELAAA